MPYVYIFELDIIFKSSNKMLIHKWHGSMT